MDTDTTHLHEIVRRAIQIERERAAELVENFKCDILRHVPSGSDYCSVAELLEDLVEEIEDPKG